MGGLSVRSDLDSGIVTRTDARLARAGEQAGSLRAVNPTT